LEDAKAGLGMGLRKGYQAVTDKLERADPVTESQSDDILIESNILGCTDPRRVRFSDGSAGQFFELICGRNSRGHAEVVEELLLQWGQVCEVSGVQVIQRVTTQEQAEPRNRSREKPELLILIDKGFNGIAKSLGQESLTSQWGVGRKVRLELAS